RSPTKKKSRPGRRLFRGMGEVDLVELSTVHRTSRSLERVIFLRIRPKSFDFGRERPSGALRARDPLPGVRGFFFAATFVSARTSRAYSESVSEAQRRLRTRS